MKELCKNLQMLSSTIKDGSSSNKNVDLNQSITIKTAAQLYSKKVVTPLSKSTKGGDNSFKSKYFFDQQSSSY
jgi:hypothetical protein